MRNRTPKPHAEQVSSLITFFEARLLALCDVREKQFATAKRARQRWPKPMRKWLLEASSELQALYLADFEDPHRPFVKPDAVADYGPKQRKVTPASAIALLRKNAWRIARDTALELLRDAEKLLPPELVAAALEHPDVRRRCFYSFNRVPLARFGYMHLAWTLFAPLDADSEILMWSKRDEQFAPRIEATRWAAERIGLSPGEVDAALRYENDRRTGARSPALEELGFNLRALYLAHQKLQPAGAHAGAGAGA